MKNHLSWFACLILVGFCFTNCQSKKEQEKTTLEKEFGKFKLVEDINLAGGKLYRAENYATDLIQPRNVDVWLPDNYSPEKKYTVLYMHDGQMLFDSATTWNKQEWKVDEWATQLMKEGKTKDFMVVAVHNIKEIRWQDYFPQDAFYYMPEEAQKNAKQALAEKNITLNANQYLKFLVNELKPEIDKTFSTQTNQENTLIAGSSMGGLISMYAISEYPETFGGAGCLSTHWVGVTQQDPKPEIPKAFFAYLAEKAPNPVNHKLYFDYGTETLDAEYVQYADDVDSVFLAKGYDDSNFVNLKFEGTDHSENSWNQRLDEPFIFLLKK